MTPQEFTTVSKKWKEELKKYEDDKNLCVFEQKTLKGGADNVIAVHNDFVIVFNSAIGLSVIKDNKEYKCGCNADSMRKALALGYGREPRQMTIYDY